MKMAYMIPANLIEEDFNSAGEMTIYEKLEQLPDTYYVFYSVRWSKKTHKSQSPRRSRVVWGEADFVVFHPSYGLIVIEVKDGEISTDYSGKKWIQTNRQTHENHFINPLEQAERSKYFFLDLLKESFGGNSPWTLCSAVWFPTASRRDVSGSLPIDYKEEFVLWQNDYESPQKIEGALRRIYSFYDAKKWNPSDAMTQKAINVLSPHFGVFQSVKGRAEMAKVLFRRMTNEQAYLLDYLEEQDVAAIHGVAGTGKTMLALEKAKRLAIDEKVLFLCFNKFLKDHLTESITDSNIDVYNLDTLYLKCTGQSFPSNQTEKDEAILRFLDDWEGYPQLDYTHIIIDEGQDFLEEHLMALYDIAEKNKGCFYVFFDKNQFVQGRNYAHWLDTLECRLVLSRNCRNTKEIALTSTRPIGIDEEKVKMRFEGEFGTPVQPNLFFAPDKEAVKSDIAKLIEKYLKAGLTEKDIVVLSCKSSASSILEKEDYCLTPQIKLSEENDLQGILFTTVRKFKGLEATAVICVDIDAASFSSDNKAFYVGTSRATTFLELITMDSVENLSYSLTGEKKKGPLGRNALSETLLVKIGSSKDLVSS